jgi:hypothetical protein
VEPARVAAGTFHLDGGGRWGRVGGALRAISSRPSGSAQAGVEGQGGGRLVGSGRRRARPTTRLGVAAAIQRSVRRHAGGGGRPQRTHPADQLRPPNPQDHGNQGWTRSTRVL